MSGSIWDELAIAPTTDETAIRRAYAIRLKQTRPDDDPEAFRRLRAAYEAALGGASQTPPHAQHPGPEPPPSPPALHQAIARRIGGGDVKTAAGLLLATRGDSTIPIGPWMGMTDFLACRIAQDAAIADEMVEDIARQFGWIDAQDSGATPAIRAVRSRVAAIRWVAGIRKDAAKFTRFLGNEHSAAAALLAGKGRLTVSRVLPPYAHLQRLLSALAAHAPWTERAFDPDRIADLQALNKDQGGRRLRNVIAMICVILTFCITGQIAWGLIAPIILLRFRAEWQRPAIIALLTVAACLAVFGISSDLGLRLVFVFTFAAVLVWVAHGVRRAIRLNLASSNMSRRAIWFAFRLVASSGAGYVLHAIPMLREFAGLAVVACFCLLTVAPRLMKRRGWPGPRHREVRQSLR